MYHSAMKEIRLFAVVRSTARLSTVALLAGILCAFLPLPVGAQSATDLAVLKGLAPVAALSKTYEGRAALAANLTVTGGIQTGAVRQPTLLPFADQQQQALTGRLHHRRRPCPTRRRAWDDARRRVRGARPLQSTARYTNLSQAVADLIAYADATTDNSNAGKYFFANATTDGKTPVSDEAAAIL